MFFWEPQLCKKNDWFTVTYHFSCVCGGRTMRKVSNMKQFGTFNSRPRSLWGAPSLVGIENFCRKDVSENTNMAASQNAWSGSIPKTHRRSRPPIQTCDPDRSRPHDPDRSRPHGPDLWSRPLCFILVGHFLLQSTEKYYSALQSTTPVLLCTTKYYSVLQTTIGISWILEKFDHPVPDLVPDRSRPVPDQFHGIQGQCPFTAMLPKKKKQVCASSAESFDSVYVVIEMIIMIPGTPFQTCGKNILRKWSFQTSGSPRNDPDPFIDPCPYIKMQLLEPIYTRSDLGIVTEGAFLLFFGDIACIHSWWY